MFIDGGQGFRDDVEAVLVQKGALHVNGHLHHDARGVLPRPPQPATEWQYRTLVETTVDAVAGTLTPGSSSK